ncbi:MAG: hypothetical protein L0Y48_05690 [Fusobacteria bacterium]|nr:hypothetical protein [Fusobacteriota bacterium]
MKNKTTVFMFLIFVLLAIVAVIVTVNKDNNKDKESEIKYAVTGTQAINSRMVVKVMAGVFAGEDVDPFAYVRLIDKFNMPYYPLNGFTKLSMNKGDSKEMSFEFSYPKTAECILEIKDSSGKVTKYEVTFPEVINQPIQNIK